MPTDNLLTAAEALAAAVRDGNDTTEALHTLTGVIDAHRAAEEVARLTAENDRLAARIAANRERATALAAKTGKPRKRRTNQTTN